MHVRRVVEERGGENYCSRQELRGGNRELTEYNWTSVVLFTPDDVYWVLSLGWLEVAIVEDQDEEVIVVLASNQCIKSLHNFIPITHTLDSNYLQFSVYSPELQNIAKN